MEMRPFEDPGEKNKLDYGEGLSKRKDLDEGKISTTAARSLGSIHLSSRSKHV
jgi:hypothetical protein